MESATFFYCGCGAASSIRAAPFAVDMWTAWLAAGDLARSDKHTRAVATRKTRDNMELLASLIRDTNKTDKDTARSCAVMAYCAMVGAISMARAVSDKALSREILRTVAQRLKPGTTREQ